MGQDLIILKWMDGLLRGLLRYKPPWKGGKFCKEIKKETMKVKSTERRKTGRKKPSVKEIKLEKKFCCCETSTNFPKTPHEENWTKLL